jgi:hypothetical protein
MVKILPQWAHGEGPFGEVLAMVEIPPWQVRKE